MYLKELLFCQIKVKYLFKVINLGIIFLLHFSPGDLEFSWQQNNELLLHLILFFLFSLTLNFLSNISVSVDHILQIESSCITVAMETGPTLIYQQLLKHVLAFFMSSGLKTLFKTRSILNTKVID